MPKASDGNRRRRRERVRPRRDDVRRQILEAAAREFARQGIDAASLEDIAATAGFTKGAVYSNFASKDELVLALVDAQVTSRLRSSVDALDASREKTDHPATVLGDRLTAATVEHPEEHVLFLELWQRAIRDPDTAARLARGRHEVRAAIVAAIKEQVDQLGIALALPPEHLAVVILALSNGLAIERFPDPAVVPDRLFGDVLTVLLTSADARDAPS